jgi:hypothetical protein
MIRMLLLLCLVACGDNLSDGHVVLLDAMPDAELDCASPDPDAGVTCCRFAPDEDAIRACAKPTFAEGSCGVVACEIPDTCDEFLRVNVCNYPDGGSP